MGLSRPISRPMHGVSPRLPNLVCHHLHPPRCCSLPRFGLYVFRSYLSILIHTNSLCFWLCFRLSDAIWFFVFGDFLRRFFWWCVAQVRVGVGGWIRVDCSNSRDTEFHYNGCKLLNFIFVNSIAYQTISFFFRKKMLIDDGFWWIDGSFLGWSCWMIPDRAW